MKKIKKTKKYRIVTKKGYSIIQRKIKVKTFWREYTYWDSIHEDKVVFINGKSVLNGKFETFKEADEFLKRKLKHKIVL